MSQGPETFLKLEVFKRSGPGEGYGMVSSNRPNWVS